MLSSVELPLRAAKGDGSMPFIASAVRSRLQPLASCVWFVTMLQGCLVEDGDKACGKNQELVEGGKFCRCAAGFIMDVSTGFGCKACGENEESLDAECVCSAGYTRPSAGAACAMSSVGAACTDSTGCSGTFSYCASDEAGGYCTSQGCSSSSECERGFLCEQEGGTGVCKKVPDGYGQSCESAADCAGTQATYCDTFFSKTCIVQNCSKTAPCPGDWSCCDIPLARAVLCVEPDALMDGACPAGGTMVKP